MAGKDIRGVIVPILTPLNSDESVDTSSMRRLVNYLLDNGAHGIWVDRHGDIYVGEVGVENLIHKYVSQEP